MEPAAALAPAPTEAPPAGAGWIVGRDFDLVWFFGGAALSLLVFGLTLWAGVSLALLYWGWTLFIDGPHIGATYTRTYPDREEWRTRGRFFVGSALISLAVGPVFLLGNVLTGREEPFLLFLGLMGFYSYHHVVRQHWGFTALYRAKARERVDLQLDRWCLYVGCWAPYLHLLLIHPWARQVLQLPAEPGAWARAGGIACIAAWLGAVGLFAGRSLLRRAPVARIKVGYVLVTLLLYGVAYFGVARLEPVWPRPQSAEQAFMLVSLMVTLLHGPQYLGLVWFHNRRRYGEEGPPPKLPPQSRGEGPETPHYRGEGPEGPLPVVDHGLARALNASLARYLGALLLFSALFYCVLAAWTGAYPLVSLFAADARWGPVSPTQVGLALWWGLALHHYLLDQRIWRIRGDEALRHNLAL